MGEQMGIALQGSLHYAPLSELERVRDLPVDVVTRTALFADVCRLNTLYMIARAGSGHIGSSFSSLDIVSWLVLNELRPPAAATALDGDLYFSSKGHDAPGYYAALIGAGRLDFELLNRLRQLDGLPGHPDVGTPGIVTNTGSLGMGISKAKGMVRANRLLGRRGRVFVMTGDGELQEGQFWESLQSAANEGLHEITAIVDHNKLQSDTFVTKVGDLGDLALKLRAFGWHVERVDGHDIAAFAAVLRTMDAISDRPKILIADTVKGRGVSFMEHTAMESDATLYRFHSGAPDADSYTRAALELIDRINGRLGELGAAPLALETAERRAVPAAGAGAQRLVAAYSKALLEAAAAEPRLVALDADLALDTGLIPFRDAFPDRFVECGIAEQDMVSQAGAMALRGLLPVVHSFACFLSARPNEQIYNNATERTKVVYVGSLAGVLPGGPGHSHQAVRDIAALAAVPGLTMIEPCNEQETKAAVTYACAPTTGSIYLRLTSIPVEIPFELPADYRLVPGQGTLLREGKEALVIGYGPVLLAEAFRAAQQLSAEQGLEVAIVNLPWLNAIDAQWLAGLAAGRRIVVTLDNHYLVGGQGDRICSTLAESGVLSGTRLVKLGIADIPVCGTNAEVLAAHGLSAVDLVSRIAKLVADVADRTP
jgi:transketolase